MISADDIRELARSLVNDLAPEARIRCAIGRSYYAAYHYCKQAADQWCGDLSPGELESAGMHIKLYRRLEEHSKRGDLDDKLREMAQEAKKLRDLRVIADYELGGEVGQKDFMRGLSYMNNVHRTLQEVVAAAGKSIKP